MGTTLRQVTRESAGHGQLLLSKVMGFKISVEFAKVTRLWKTGEGGLWKYMYVISSRRQRTAEDRPAVVLRYGYSRKKKQAISRAAFFSEGPCAVLVKKAIPSGSRESWAWTSNPGVKRLPRVPWFTRVSVYRVSLCDPAAIMVDVVADLNSQWLSTDRRDVSTGSIEKRSATRVFSLSSSTRVFTRQTTKSNVLFDGTIKKSVCNFFYKKQCFVITILISLAVKPLILYNTQMSRTGVYLECLLVMKKSDGTQ